MPRNNTVIQRYEATKDGDRRVFVLKYVGSASTGYALYQHGDGGLSRLERIDVDGRRQNDKAAEKARRLVERVYAGPEWDVSPIGV